MNPQTETAEAMTQTQSSQPLLSPEETQTLEQRVIEKLKTVIDPETGVDVFRMRLVLNMVVDTTAVVHYIFRPSSPICPIAVQLAMELKRAVASVEGVVGQEIQVVEYIQADVLTQMINAWDPTQAGTS